MLYSQTILIIAYISLAASNIIVIDEFDANTNEYHCNQHESCTIGCLSTGSCAGTTLYCPSNHDCTIICDGRTTNANNTCFNSTIRATNASYLSISITAHQSNAESMTVHAPYDSYLNTNHHKQSILTCNSAAHNMNQCKDINIYTNQGFDDIKLKCNDATSHCHISGTMQCQFHKNDNININNHTECTTFEYKNTHIGYECANNNFCVIHTPTISPTMSPMSNITLIDGHNVLTQEIYVSESKAKDIHSLVLVIVGTVIICCVVLILLALCGLLFVRFNRDSVEEMLIKRYMSGRGSSMSSIGFTPAHNASNDTSNDMDGLSDTATQSNTSNNFELELEEDRISGNSNEISFNINNNRCCIDMNNINDNSDIDHDTDSNELGLSNTILRIQNIENNSNEIKVQNDIHIMDNDEMNNDVHIIYESVQNNNQNVNVNVNPLFHNRDDISLSADSLTVIAGELNSYHTSCSTDDIMNAIQHEEDEHEHGQHEAMDDHEINTCNDNTMPPIPLPIFPINKCFSEPILTEKQRQIHEEYMKNRAKSYGYSQPEILYEEDENYTDDSTTNTSSSADTTEITYNGHIFVNNGAGKHNNIHTLSIKNNISNISKDMSMSMSPMTDSDDLLDDGKTINNINNDVHVNTLSVPLSMSDIKDDPEIISDDGHYPNLPPHAIIFYGKNLSVNNLTFRL